MEFTMTFTGYELDVLDETNAALLGSSSLADHGKSVSDVHLAGCFPTTTIMVTWRDSKRSNKTFTESWGLYDGGYPDGVAGTTSLTPAGTIASVVFSNLID